MLKNSEKAANRLVEVRTTKYYFQMLIGIYCESKENEFFKANRATTKARKNQE